MIELAVAVTLSVGPSAMARTGVRVGLGRVALERVATFIIG